MLPKDTLVSDAAKRMKGQDIGDVVVMDDGSLYGIVTDVVRAIAENRDPRQTRLSDIATTDLVTVRPDDDVDTAIDMMRKNAVRRIPVVEWGKPIGIVSLGDLAQRRDPQSVLGQVSAAPPQHKRWSVCGRRAYGRPAYRQAPGRSGCAGRSLNRGSPTT
jgi:signal-transduction protein with cAMP-binding, CBS, and nucleotidyltransferase domain